MSQKHTALVVDDDPGSRRLLARWLEEEGWSVIEAASGQMALSRAREKEPDLVLLDIRMPGFLDGLRVSEVLSENPALQAVPIIAVSASPQETFRHQALAAGCSGFLSKPVNFKELREEIARLLPAGKRG